MCGLPQEIAMCGLFVTELCVGNPGSLEPPKKTQDAKKLHSTHPIVQKTIIGNKTRNRK